MIFDKYANLKYKYDNRHFWHRGYYTKKERKDCTIYKGIVTRRYSSI
mgnify:FL=1|jgi:hypothetical protein